MKKLTFLVAGCISLLSAFSQTQKGSKLVGVGIGGFSYSSSESKGSYDYTPTVSKSESSSFSISVNPNVAWFVQDNLAIGGGVSINFSTSKGKNSSSTSPNTTESKSNSPSFYIGPLARYYFGKSTSGMPFVQVNAQYGIYGGKATYTYTNSANDYEAKTKPKGDWNAGASFGYEHFVNSNIGLYASIGFNYAQSKTLYEYRYKSGVGNYDYTSDYSRFYIPVNVGLQVHILGKKGKK